MVGLNAHVHAFAEDVAYFRGAYPSAPLSSYRNLSGARSNAGTISTCRDSLGLGGRTLGILRAAFLLSEIVMRST